ncbi:DDB1- and CUL4-associated factor 11-like isoform X2 [Apostichopus japonicus]|uniref:DDB1- and CUL4-associated factor 11-like isoform X2 n=1 Tax=Stichopus japonicus TaxID=307972 RepID=UPI003AB1634B
MKKWIMQHLFHSYSATDVTPDTSKIDQSQFKQSMLFKAGQPHYGTIPKPTSVNHLLRKRQSNGGLIEMGRPYMHEKSMFTASFLPNNGTELDRFPSKLFCGTYSQDGNVFLSACQDQYLRLFDVSKGQFKLFRAIKAQDVGWSVLDTAFSPDGCYLIYSSWSENIHICNIHGDYETHSALDLNPSQAQFCAFSIQFSSDNKEILAGANDGNLYIYDREKGERTLMVDAHEDDVNAVCFADSSSQILFSGGDDGLCKVWDRRMLSESNSSPVGTLAGHSDGITFIDTKGDTRHLISNSKDQSIKLWDMRCFSSENAVENARRAVAQQEWDYRWQRAPRRSRRRILVKGDTSLMTYRGHGVLHTLLRCRFSPKFTTDQNYIYSACATGKVIIYDALTGQVVRTLSEGHGSCVRDVSWHPYENKIISSGWDERHILWEYKENVYYDSDMSDISEDEDGSDEDDIFKTVRRSRRLKDKREQSRRRRGGGRNRTDVAV